MYSILCAHLGLSMRGGRENKMLDKPLGELRAESHRQIRVKMECLESRLKEALGLLQGIVSDGYLTGPNEQRAKNMIDEYWPEEEGEE